MPKIDRISHYLVQERLGRGSFSTVYRGVDSRDNSEVAIKVVDRSKLSNPRLVDREIEILKALDHPSIVELKDIIRPPDSKYIFIIMEYLAGGELFDYVVGSSRLSEKKARPFLRDLISALEYCHSNLIVHRGRSQNFPKHLMLRFET